MLWVDYLILGIVLVSAIIGFFRGFIREIISLAVWVVAFVAAVMFADPISHWLPASVEPPSMRKALAGTSLFVLVLLLGGIAGFLAGRLVSASGLAGTDRSIGGVFGLVRGAVLVIILMLLAALTPMPQDDWWRDSRLIPHLQPYALWVTGLLPADIARHINFAPAAAAT